MGNLGSDIVVVTRKSIYWAYCGSYINTTGMPQRVTVQHGVSIMDSLIDSFG